MGNFRTDPITRRQAVLALGALGLSSCMPESIAGPAHQAASLTDDTALLDVVGDFHAAPGKEAVNRAVVSLLERNPTATIAMLGDNAGVHGSPAEYQVFEQYAGHLKPRMQAQLGNHDVDDGLYPQATAYYDCFNHVGQADGIGGPRGKAYHAWNPSPFWRVYAMNTEQRRSEQLAWLAADLPLWPHVHKLVLMHKPMFASFCDHGPHGSDGTTNMAVPEQVGPWWDLFVKHRVETALSGHIHRYERFPPMLRDGTWNSAGVRQFILGTGGGVKMRVTTKHPLSRKQVVEHGVLRLKLTPTAYTWGFVDIFGVVRDTGSQTCRKLALAA